MIEHLGDADGVLALDETGFLKKGTSSAGVARMDSGTAGRIENCQIGVFLAYVTPRGHALIDRELYLPQVWTEDRPCCRAVHIPDDVEFATKPQLARRLLMRAKEAGVPASWVAADEVYGSDDQFRRCCEQMGLGYVVAISSATHLFFRGAALGCRSIWHGFPQTLGNDSPAVRETRENGCTTGRSRLGRTPKTSISNGAG